MTQLETYESTAPLTGTIAEQRRKRRQAFRRFLEQQLRRRLSNTELEQLYSYLRERTRRIEAETALAEERTLRQMVEAENAELRTQVATLQSDILANDAYFVDRNDDGTWTVVRTMTANILLEDVKRENAELVAQNMALKTEIADWVIGSDGEDTQRVR